MKALLPYFRYLKGYRLVFAFAVFCGILFGVTSGLGIPVIFEKVFKKVFESPEAVYSTSEIILIASIVPGVFFLRGIFSFLNTYLMNYCGLKITQGIRQDVFKKMQFLPFSYFENSYFGDLLAKTTTDPAAIQLVMLETASEIFRQPIQMFSAIAGLCYLSYQHGNYMFILLFLGAIPFLVFPVKWIRRNLKKRSQGAVETNARVCQHISENLNAIQEVRSFAMESKQIKLFGDKADEYVKSELKLIKYERTQQPVMEFVSAILIGIVFLYGYNKSIPFSTFSAMGLALYFAFDPLKKISQTFSKAHRAHASIQRINEILALPISIKDNEDSQSVEKLKGEIRFDDMSFSYKDELVLKNINADIKAGTSCALVGPSGAGKTTFIKLLLRFYDVNQGSIQIDGLNIKNIKIEDLRRNIGLVPQQPMLFDETIYENIAFGNPHATKEDVIAAAKKAFAHDFISHLEKGYDTKVGHRGDRLSGGQRQRIAIARAFLKNAPILLLDEATSALDSESEHFIQMALKELTAGRTVFTIAHRLSTIKDSDQILVFDRGLLVGSGSHEELLKTNELYQSLVEKQQL